jgi:hypothetical protein
MTGILLAVVLPTAAAIVSLVVLYAAVTRSEAVPAGVVDPFQTPTGTDPSADTLPTGCAMAKTTPPAAGDWQVTTLTNLTQVEDLLDCLEAQGFAEREVIALGNASFAVRWR